LINAFYWEFEYRQHDPSDQWRQKSTKSLPKDLDVEAISDIREFCVEQRFSPVAPCRSIQAWLLRFI
jgi:hypothetical protein